MMKTNSLDIYFKERIIYIILWFKKYKRKELWGRKKKLQNSQCIADLKILENILVHNIEKNLSNAVVDIKWAKYKHKKTFHADYTNLRDL